MSSSERLLNEVYQECILSEDYIKKICNIISRGSIKNGITPIIALHKTCVTVSIKLNYPELTHFVFPISIVHACLMKLIEKCILRVRQFFIYRI